MRRPSGRTLACVVAERALSAPDAPAIFCEGEVVSYAALDARAGEAARGLHALGIRAGGVVGVLLPNEPRWVVMALAAARLGATLVPLNTWYRRQELEWTLAHCGISVLVTADRINRTDYRALLSEIVPALGAPRREGLAAAHLPALRAVVFCDEAPAGGIEWPAFLRGGEEVASSDLPRAEAASPEGAAYILYTSGSSAEPKGVILRHRGVIENGFDLGQRRGIVADDRVWLGTPLFYALGATNALPATFTAGAALVLQRRFEAGAAISAIEATRATVYYATGNISHAILEHPDYRQSRIGSLSKGNAGLSESYKRMTLVSMGISGAVPAYGLTETYGNATVGEPDHPLERKLAANGRPLPGMEIAIVDPRTGAPLPGGETGLILVRGHTTPGYLGNPEAGRDTIRADGFLDTGDLGSIDRNGDLVFHSRLKDVIKTGGINVSPSEVEQLICAHPDVRDAFVVGIPDAERGELIVAFVDRYRPLSEDTLKAWLREHAASFKVPHHVLFRSEDTLPRLASGKVARHRLREDARAALAGR